MISWNEVVKCFGQSNYSVLRAVDSSEEYWNQSTLYRDMVADDRTVLYIVHSGCLNQVMFDNQVAVIILGNNDFNSDDIPKGIGNALNVIEAEAEPKGIIQLNQKFQYQFRMGYLLSFLQDAIVKDLGIQTMVELISQFFEEPVALLDTSLHFIAKSQFCKPDYSKSIYPDSHEKASFDENVINFLRKFGVLKKMISSTEPFFFKVEGEGAYYIPVMISNIKVAYFIIYSNSPEKWKVEYYLNLFPMLVKTISIEMAKDNFYLLNKGNYYNYIFLMLLSEQETDLDDIKMRLKVYDYDLRDNMYLIEIDTEMYKNVSLHKDLIADSIRRSFRNSFYVFKDDKIYYLVSRSDNDLITRQEMDLWEQTLELQKLIAAVTGPFKSLKKLKQHLREVELVLQAQKYIQEKGTLFSFEQFQAKAMLASLRSREEISIFMFRPVLDIAEYDRIHGSELVLTLKEYLKHPKNINAICDVLCIHKNTLYKRLNKIESIMKCDFHNGEIIMKIELTFEMMEIDREAF
jgi:sugar diacid utilization regulator